MFSIASSHLSFAVFLPTLYSSGNRLGGLVIAIQRSFVPFISGGFAIHIHLSDHCVELSDDQIGLLAGDGLPTSCLTVLYRMEATLRFLSCTTGYGPNTSFALLCLLGVFRRHTPSA
jgi:hypothetical protein